MAANARANRSKTEKFFVLASRVLNMWGLASIILIILGTFEMLPLYEIKFERKSALDTALAVYPQSTIQLSADPRGGRIDEYEGFSWSLNKASGEVYMSQKDLHDGTPITITLLPDSPGTINVEVEARKRGQQSASTGRTSFQVVQNKPIVASIRDAKLQLKFDDFGTALEAFTRGGIQLEAYAGDNKWETLPPGNWSVNSESDTLSVDMVTGWDGIAYMRYRVAGVGEPPSRAAALPVVEARAEDVLER